MTLRGGLTIRSPHSSNFATRRCRVAPKHFVAFCGLAMTSLCLTLGGCATPSVPPGARHADAASPKTNLWARWSPSSTRPALSDAAKQLKHPTKVYLKYAEWQEEIGKLVEARKSYELVLGQNPKSVDAILGLARLDHLAGRVSQAEQGYLKAVRLKPNDPGVLDALGEFYVAEERWDQAIDVLNSAVLLSPDHSGYRYHLAVALAESGDVEGAIPHFARTVGEAEAHYNVGYILYEQGHKAAAKQQFQQALLKNPQLAQAQAMLDELGQSEDEQSLMAQQHDPGTVAAKTRNAVAARTEANRSWPAERVQRAASRRSNTRPLTEQSQTEQPADASASSRIRRPAAPLPNSAHTGPTSFGTALPPPSHVVAAPRSAETTPQQREQWQNQRTLDEAN